MALRHPSIGMAELPGDHRHGDGRHGKDRGVGMPQHMEADCRADTCALAAVTHRAQLLGALAVGLYAFRQQSPANHPLGPC